MKNRLSLLIAVIALPHLAACSKSEDPKSILTSSKDGILFENAYFGLAVKMPNGWYFQDPKSTMKLTQKGAGLMAGDNKNMKAILDETLKTTVPLFAFFEHEPGAPVKHNASVVSFAENIEVAPGIKTGCDYLFHARRLLESAAVKMNVSEGCATKTINGTTFGQLEVTTNMNGVEVRQEYYACVKSTHALSFIETYFDDESRAVTAKVIDTLVVVCQ